MKAKSKVVSAARIKTTTKQKIAAFSTFLSASIFSPLSISSGLTINEQSASAGGTAYSGRSSSAIDASTVYGNPAGMTKLKSRQVVGGFSVIDAKNKISNVETSASGTSNGESIPLTAVPFAFYAQPYNDRVWLGLGSYVSAGIVNDYESSFQGRYWGSYSNIRVLTLQPTIAFKLNDKLSFGFGPTINRIDGKLQNYLATGPFNNGKETRLSLSGDDTALGYNAGIIYELTNAATIGLTYHSQVNYHLKGKLKISGAPDTFDINRSYDTKLDQVYPEAVDASITYRFSPKWTGYLGTTWANWSKLKSLDFHNDTPDTALGQGLAETSEPLHWKDVWSFAVGASYQIDNKWQLRAGFAYDPSPAHNDYKSVRMPTGNRKAYTIGAGYSLSEDITIDFAYGYVKESETSVLQENMNDLQPSYSAKFNNDGNVLATQLTYKF
ncbi:TPA: outer membrane protein transport protein [Pseudomonas aeruginosa]|uniref:OmpP1/FadL family transporter n=1 Tax=Pseudomonas aeruginosa TaxID=287 RepID=UPI000F879356|nr:outer membrane protein transport protein [Pseudomonas aeruginosa]RUI00775.1 transporter [Pseudomonas aeruginosa]HBO3119417.1 outer membrane protein transport protein [Pseudomonas aeruginosa]